MKKRIGLILLTTMLLTSCRKIYNQKNWHINSVELADEYFPKYFEAIEESLSKNNIEYEKKYSKKINKEYKWKYYLATYNISKNIYFYFIYEFDKKTSDVDCYFHYKLTTEEQALNLPQSYINVMIDTVNFCSHNFLGTGEMYNTFYDEVKEKYKKNEINGTYKKYSKILIGEKYDSPLPSRGINLYFANEEYNLEIYLYDYLTDINIWNK